MKKAMFCLLGGSLLWCGTAWPATGAEENPLMTLRREHPRLMLARADWDALRMRTTHEPVARQMLQDLCAEADRILKDAPIEHKLIGPRLLDQSRKALYRITLWAGLYRLTGKTEYAARARQEMLTAAAFKDWNPSHFLDVAEMTTALALGYDWLYDVLPARERATIRQAIVEKGLKPGLGDTPGAGGRFWVKVHHNWNQVCNGGLGVGALAIADEEPQLAARVLKQSLGGIPLALASYAPDGGWAEGPGYWDYATQYTAYFLAALDSALGKDFGLKQSPGLDRAGLFHIYTAGPQNLAFNFADAGAHSGPSSSLFWLARAFHQPVYAAYNFFTGTRLKDPFYLFWLPPAPLPEAALVDKLPPNVWFHGVDVVCLRSGWEHNATYLGFKGGDNKANHSHLDLGTFVLDMNGARWCEDLGSDNYNLPGYFGKQRWTYYRLKTEGHNVVTLGGANQNPAAKALIAAFDPTPGHAYAIADLTAGYAPTATSLRRGVMLLGNNEVLVQDEIRLGQLSEIIWAVHTPAEITIRGREAQLQQKGQTVVVRLLEPTGGQFENMALPKEPETGHPLYTHKLGIRLPATQAARVVVLFTSADEGGKPRPVVHPLAAWPNGSAK